jgi:hypothetical protein
MYGMPWDAGHQLVVAIYSALNSCLVALTLYRLAANYIGSNLLPGYGNKGFPQYLSNPEE